MAYRTVNIVRNFFYKGRKNTLSFEYRDFHDFNIKKEFEGSVFIRRKKHNKCQDYCVSFSYHNIDDNCSMSNGFNVVDGDIDELKYALGVLEFLEYINISTVELVRVREGLEDYITSFKC